MKKITRKKTKKEIFQKKNAKYTKATPSFDEALSRFIWFMKGLLIWFGFAVFVLAQPYVQTNYMKNYYAALYKMEAISILVSFGIAYTWQYIKKRNNWTFQIASRDNIEGINMAFISLLSLMLIPYYILQVQLFLEGKSFISRGDPAPIGLIGQISYFFLPSSILTSVAIYYWRIFDFLVYFDKTTKTAMIFLLLSAFVALLPNSIFTSILQISFFAIGIVPSLYSYVLNIIADHFGRKVTTLQ